MGRNWRGGLGLAWFTILHVKLWNTEKQVAFVLPKAIKIHNNKNNIIYRSCNKLINDENGNSFKISILEGASQSCHDAKRFATQKPIQTEHIVIRNRSSINGNDISTYSLLNRQSSRKQRNETKCRAKESGLNTLSIDTYSLGYWCKAKLARQSKLSLRLQNKVKSYKIHYIFFCAFCLLSNETENKTFYIYFILFISLLLQYALWQ